MPPPPRKKRKAALEPLWESEARSSPKKAGRALVLEAAANAFMERGYSATTLDDIAILLGTTKGQIYHYYRSKLDLYFDVGVGAFYMVNERMSEAAERAGGSAVDRLRHGVHAVALEIMQNYPFHRVALEATQFQLIGRLSTAQERAQERIGALRKQLETTLGSLIGDAVNEGGLYVPSIPLATKAAVGSITWLIVWYDPKRSTPPEKCERIAGGVADFVLGGLQQSDVAA
jgi:AcrR family transcriptional regulator